MNMFELGERLKDFSKDQLISEMRRPSGSVPQFLVLSELQRRSRMERAAMSEQPQQSTVAEDAVAAAGVPQGGLMQIARSLAPSTDMDKNTGVTEMNGGGVVRMQDGGLSSVRRDLGDYMPTYQTWQRMDEDERLDIGITKNDVDEIAERLGVSPDEAFRIFSGTGTTFNEFNSQTEQQGEKINLPAGTFKSEEQNSDFFQPLRNVINEATWFNKPFPDSYPDVGDLSLDDYNADVQAELEKANRPAGTLTSQGPASDPLGDALRETLGKAVRKTVSGAESLFSDPYSLIPDDYEPGITFDEYVSQPEQANKDVNRPVVLQPDRYDYSGIYTGTPLTVDDIVMPPLSGSGNYAADFRAGIAETQKNLEGSNSPNKRFGSENYDPDLGLPIQPARDALRNALDTWLVKPFTDPYTPEKYLQEQFSPSSHAEEITWDNTEWAPSNVYKDLLPDTNTGATVNNHAEEITWDNPDTDTVETVNNTVRPRPRPIDIRDEPKVATGGAGGSSGAGRSSGGIDSDRLYEQDKWLALAQFGLSLMSSRQPTLGSAIGEAGQAGIAALRDARESMVERQDADRAMRLREAVASQKKKAGLDVPSAVRYMNEISGTIKDMIPDGYSISDLSEGQREEVLRLQSMYNTLSKIVGSEIIGSATK